jgi:uncharacterized protein YndB with AHSA1/START domain
MSPLTLSYETYIKATPARLWDALVNPELTVLYDFGSAVESTWEVGSRIVYRMDGGTGGVAVQGDLVEVTPPQKLVHTWEETWNEESVQDQPSLVTYEIAHMGEVCKLTVTHDGFPAATKTYEMVRGAWPIILSSLKTLLETDAPLPVPATD